MEELNQQQRDELQLDLLKLEAELEHLLRATEVGVKPVKLKDNQGRLSRMDELHNQSILMANRNLTKNRQKAVKIAQARMLEGSYGFCRGCDEPIAFPRLKAYPDAGRCITCQATAE